jgi:hypothetical protein
MKYVPILIVLLVIGVFFGVPYIYKNDTTTATSVNVKTIKHMVLDDGVLIFNDGPEYQTVNVKLNGIMFGSYERRNVIVPPNGSVGVSFRECVNGDGERFDSYRKKPTEIYVF